MRFDIYLRNGKKMAAGRMWDRWRQLKRDGKWQVTQKCLTPNPKLYCVLIAFEIGFVLSNLIKT